MSTTKRQVLHVGCGTYSPAKLHTAFHGEDWREVRLDIDPTVKPDIVASITDMHGVPSGEYDAVFSSHNLEHLYAHEVPLALREFRRVLKPEGITLVTMPDLQEIGRLLANGGLGDTAYVSGAGPIAPLDMLYGLRTAMAAGNLFMAHRTGFTGKTLIAAFQEAGFAMSVAQRNPLDYSLWGIAFVTAPSDAVLEKAQETMLPFSLRKAA